MIAHDLIQGSPEWLAYRSQHFNASDAPAMLGCSPYKTRSELLREMHTGIVGNVDAGTQRRFDDGHRFEVLARPLAEDIIGEDLYPVTGSEGRYSASFDGLTLDESTGWEHKTLNDELRAIMGGEDGGLLLPLHYRIQMEQQCHVSGAERVLFMATKWSEAAELIEARHCWYTPDAELRAEILRGWDQFAADLAAYTPPDVVEPAPVGKAPDTLPALLIEVTGHVTASNLSEFKATALGAIRAINRDLSTDADFADAEKAVKWCADVESRLRAAKEHALSQTASIDELFRTLDDIAAESKAARLDLDKLVKRRKDEVRERAVLAARAALDAHIATLNAELAPMRLQPVPADFPGAIKGLRSIASMQDALDTTLAAGKIAADGQARQIRANVATFKAGAAGLEFLFSDLGQVIHKAGDDFAALVQARVTGHQMAEAAKERQRQADEAARIAAAEQRAREQEAARIAEQQRQHAAPAATGPAPVLAQDESRGLSAALASKPDAPMHAREAAAAIADEPATLKLCTICDRLGFTVSAAFLSDALHVKPAKTDGRAMLFRESQFAVICRQLQSHIGAMAELYAGEPA